MVRFVPDVRERWALLIVLLHVAALVVLVLRYSTEILRMDEWALISKYGAGAGSFLEQLRTFHNQSHLWLTQCILDLLASCTRGSVLARTFLNISTACLTYACIAGLLRDLDDGSPRWVYPAALIGSVCAILALYQFSNWLWGVQFCVYLCLAAACYGWAALMRAGAPTRRVLWASVLGVISTLSFGAGLMYWPASLVLLWMMDERNRTVWRGMVLSSALVLCTYLWLNPGPGPFNPKPSEQTFVFFTRFIGSWYGHTAAFWAGAVGLILTPMLLMGARAACSRPGRHRVMAYAVAIIAFVVLNAAVTAIFRTGYKVGGGAANRYVTYSCYFWMALFWLALLRVTDRPRPRYQTAGVVMASVLTLAIIHLPISEAIAAQEVRTARNNVARWLVRTGQWNDQRIVLVLGENPLTIRKGAEVLRRKGYSPFEDLPPDQRDTTVD